MKQEATTPPRIVVLGSLNMDLLLRVPHAPDAGETLMGRSLDRIPGGKGGNQAVSCARQGAAVQMIGCVGDETSPGISLFGTGRSSSGHSGVPVGRSNTYKKPVLPA